MTRDLLRKIILSIAFKVHYETWYKVQECYDNTEEIFGPYADYILKFTDEYYNQTKDNKGSPRND